jgi:hypothetical protein
MKKLITISLIAAVFTAGTVLKAQDQPQEYLGLPGDNLNLYAVMKLFQDSKTLEGFEKSLNEENTEINNLDLNGDNYVDYIRVIDNVDGDVHYIVLQDMISQNESQDVAVFTVQRFPNGQVQIQLTGDEDLYGKDYIIEPFFDDENMGQTPNPGYMGNSEIINGRTVTIIRTTPVQIAAWPIIRFIYQPRYVVWRSRWYWGYYPAYWHPWRPVYWHYYYGYHYNWYNDYYSHYRRWNYHRYNHWNDYYYNARRTHSPVVSVRINSGNYKNTYSHPEQRRNGEAAYAKTYSSQSRRSPANVSGNNQVRRTSPGTNRGKESSVSNTTTMRRTTTTVNTGTVKNNNPGQDKGINRTRRSSTTVTTRQASKPATVQNAATKTTKMKSTKVSSPGRRSSGKSKSTASGKKESNNNKSETTKSERRK